MKAIDEILENKKYREQIDLLDDKKLILIARDYSAAFKAAQKGVKKNEPEQVSNKAYIAEVAYSIQKLAEKVLEERK